jgi:hypothetical protein
VLFGAIVHYLGHHLDFYSCVQMLVISSKKVSWAKQATVTLEDNQPPPPKIPGYQSDKGWKEVKNLVVKHGGGNWIRSWW